MVNSMASQSAKVSVELNSYSMSAKEYGNTALKERPAQSCVWRLYKKYWVSTHWWLLENLWPRKPFKLRSTDITRKHIKVRNAFRLRSQKYLDLETRNCTCEQRCQCKYLGLTLLRAGCRRLLSLCSSWSIRAARSNSALNSIAQPTGQEISTFCDLRK